MAVSDDSQPIHCPSGLYLAIWRTVSISTQMNKGRQAGDTLPVMMRQAKWNMARYVSARVSG